MGQVALFIRHKTKDNCRSQVQQIWNKHMPGAISMNAGHLKYFYCFNENKLNEVCAFQIYKDSKASSDFLKTDAYLKYQKEVEPFLEGPPEVTSLSVFWEKSES